MTRDQPRFAVAIPAHNEGERIGACLDSIAAQATDWPLTIVVLANNCSDNTVAVASRPRGVPVRVIDAVFEPAQQNAGHARRFAMQQAEAFGDIVLTTDADCIADADWLYQYRDAFGRGVDAVAGRVSGDWDELRHHPAEALRIGALEWEYLALIGDAEAIFDPQPHDPAPRHAQRCGANIGITRAMLQRVGGIPALPVGEDRALIAAVERADGRVRHAVGPHVTASARTSGRAAGGMAAALAARQSVDYRCDAQFDSADRLVARWQLRRRARAAWAAGDGQVVVKGRPVAIDRSQPSFGAAWEQIERMVSVQAAMRPADLPVQIDRMRQWMASGA